jgi:hypothetical protein
VPLLLLSILASFRSRASLQEDSVADAARLGECGRCLCGQGPEQDKVLEKIGETAKTLLEQASVEVSPSYFGPDAASNLPKTTFFLQTVTVRSLFRETMGTRVPGPGNFPEVQHSNCVYEMTPSENRMNTWLFCASLCTHPISTDLT